MANYTAQSSVNVLGSATTPVTLTGTYTDNDVVVPIGYADQVTLYIGYTMGAAESGNSIQVKIDFADRNLDVSSTEWARSSSEADSSGTITLTLQERTFSAVAAAGTYDVFRIKLTDVNDKYMRVSVKETGIAANGGSCYVRATIGGR